MIPAPIQTHLDRALALLTEQYKNKPVIEGFITVQSTQAQELEQVAWDVINSRLIGSVSIYVPATLDNGESEEESLIEGASEATLLMDAQGVHLDPIGELVGEERMGRSDAAYLQAIRLRVRVNRSYGRTVDVLEAARLAATEGQAIVYREHYPASFEMVIEELPGFAAVAKSLGKARPAGVYGVLISHDWDPARTVRWGYTGDPTVGQGFPSVYSSLDYVPASAREVKP